MADEEQEQVAGARTQSLFRQVNERIESFMSERHFLDGEVLCECANPKCIAPIPLIREEYEAVRHIPTRFLVAPGHTVPEIERIVEENERYVVVEKFGDAGEAAVQLDPRRSPEPSER